MLRYLIAAAAIALACPAPPALADTFTDAGGTTAPEVIDVSRTAHAAVQCALTVTSTATSLTALWLTAGCPKFPASPQFAFVMPTGGAIYYRTDGVTVSAANGWPVFQNQSWPVEGRLSVAGLQFVASANVAAIVEVRW